MGVTEPWTFGVPPLPQTEEVAGLLREVSEDVDRFLRSLDAVSG